MPRPPSPAWRSSAWCCASSPPARSAPRARKPRRPAPRRVTEMWMTILSFIGGPVIKGLIDAYQAKLKAGNVESKIAADLAAGEIAAQTSETNAITQLKIAEIGHFWEPEKLAFYIVLVHLAKCVIWDTVLG